MGRQPSRDDIILWVDLETSGLEPTAKVLEVALVATGPAPHYSVQEAFLGIIKPPAMVVAMDQFVLDMHERSGLIHDIQCIGESPERVNLRLHEWIDHVLGDNDTKVVIAGSGIHFDRPFIEREWPWLAERFAYYHHDVGVLRRMLRAVDINTIIDQNKTPHRALADLFQHIQEARTLLMHVKTDHDRIHPV